MAAGTPRGSPPTSVTPDASIATSAPVPMATPRSARASAGASLMPSPTIATVRPRPWSRSTIAGLAPRAGPRRRRRAPGCRPGRATASAVARASPVTSQISMPAAVSSRIAAADSALTGSAIAEHPDDAAVGGHDDRRPRARRRRVDGVLRPARCRPPAMRSSPAARRRPPRGPASVATVPRTPPPTTASKSPTRPKPSSRSLAQATIAAPSGCSLARSTRAGEVDDGRARRTRAPATTSVTVGRPSVSVPVLSKTTVSTRCAISSASPPRMRMPTSAPRPVPTMTAVGVASPIAHGQAMTTTPMNAVSARVSRGSGPNDEPDDERARREQQDDRDEDLGDPVGEVLDRRLAALRPADRARRSGRAPCRGRPASRASRTSRSC